MKKTISLILAFLMVISLAACGGKSSEAEEPAQEAVPAADSAAGEQETSDAAEQEASDAAEQEAPAEPAEAPSETDTPEEDSDPGPESRLLSFYHTEDGTYIMAAIRDPLGKYQYGGFGAGDESFGWYTADYGDWIIAFTQAEGTQWQAEDITLHIGGGGEDREFTFSTEDMPSPEEYTDYGLYRMGSRYVTMGRSLKYLYQSRRAFCRLDIYVCDVAMLNQDSRLSEADIPEDAFALYTGDGTPAAEFFGKPCVFSLGGFTKNEFMTTVSVYLDFFPYEESGMKDEQEPAAREMLASLMETEPYCTYTDPDGNVFEFPLTLDDIPPAYRP